MSDNCPGVGPHTWCLPNTSGRCTWCGQYLPGAARGTTRSHREFQRREQAGLSMRDFGTDPLAWLSAEDEPVADYWKAS